MAGYIGSKSVTLSTTSASVGGDSTVGGDLTVDTNTLYVDSTNNRVGVGTASPSNPFQVGTSDLIVDSNGRVGIGTASPTHKVHISTTDSTPLSVEHSNGSDVYIKLVNNADGAGNFLGASSNNLTFWTENAERMRIDSAGRVTKPYQPTFHATRTNHVTSTGVIVFDSVNLNVGSHYSSTNGRFTAPIAGSYIFAFSALLYSMGNPSLATLYVNGSVKYNMSSLGTYGSFSGSYAGQGGTVIVGLNAGDYATVHFTHAGTNLHANYTYWSGMLLG